MVGNLFTKIAAQFELFSIDQFLHIMNGMVDLHP